MTAEKTDPADRTTSQDVWYRLMKLTNLVNRPFFSGDAREYRLSINEWRMVYSLAWLGEAAAHELAETCGMHPMNVSRSLAVLRRQDRVRVRVDPDNRRRRLFSLTPRGKALYHTISPHMQERADQLFKLVSPREIDQLGRIIDRLIQGLGNGRDN